MISNSDLRQTEPQSALHSSIRCLIKFFAQIGIIKEIDELGRLVIPKEMRQLFRFEKVVEVVVAEDGVLVRKPQYILVEKK